MLFRRFEDWRCSCLSNMFFSFIKIYLSSLFSTNSLLIMVFGSINSLLSIISLISLSSSVFCRISCSLCYYYFIYRSLSEKMASTVKKTSQKTPRMIMAMMYTITRCITQKKVIMIPK